MPENILYIDKHWKKNLQTNDKGQYIQSPQNVMIILNNDENLKGAIKENKFSNKLMRIKPLPWREDTGEWDDKDDASLRNYLYFNYGIKKLQIINDAFSEFTLYNHYHPIRDYLNSVIWDGVPRIDTLLIDYFGAADTPYTRAVTRKMMCGAVARMYKPGCKFDYCLILVGKQGIGKSSFFRMLAGDYFTDDVKISSTSDKTYESIKGSWIVEISELAALKKAEVEEVKQCITKQADKVRIPWAKHPQEFKRNCIFVGSTNNTEFLRDVTGNRRFWPVDTSNNVTKDIFSDTLENERDQIWAEARYYYDNGEPLFLDRELETVAREEQEKKEIELPWKAEIERYLATRIPEKWERMGKQERRRWFVSEDIGDKPPGVKIREKVCLYEIWNECLAGDIRDLTNQHKEQISNIMNKLPNWDKVQSPTYFPMYHDGKTRTGWIYKVGTFQKG